MRRKKNYTKQYQNPEGYINKLMHEGLNIKNKNSAIDVIYLFGYENFKPYVESFRMDNGSFPTNIDFKDVLFRNLRDYAFRKLIFPQALQLEVLFKSCFVDFLASKYGTHPYTLEVYRNDESKENFDFFFQNLVQKTDNNIIKRYRRKYKFPKLPPVWDLAHASTFGQIKRWFTALSEENQSEIAKRMGVNKVKVFRSWLGTVVEIRNESAHNGVLFNIKLKNEPSVLERSGKINVPNSDNNKLKSSLEVLDTLLDSRCNFMEKKSLFPSMVKGVEKYFTERKKLEPRNNMNDSEERELSGFSKK